MASTSCSFRRACPSASRTTGTICRKCSREASSGTTPPYLRCTSSCDATILDRISRPSTTTAAAVSSQEDSMPKMRVFASTTTSLDPSGTRETPRQTPGSAEPGVWRGVSRVPEGSKLVVVEANTRILGIESSCDETAAAVVVDGREILSSIVASQLDVHRKYGGVVPELASREHLRQIVPVVREALGQEIGRAHV